MLNRKKDDNYSVEGTMKLNLQMYESQKHYEWSEYFM